MLPTDDDADGDGGAGLGFSSVACEDDKIKEMMHEIAQYEADGAGGAGGKEAQMKKFTEMVILARDIDKGELVEAERRRAEEERARALAAVREYDQLWEDHQPERHYHLRQGGGNRRSRKNRRSVRKKRTGKKRRSRRSKRKKRSGKKRRSRSRSR